MSFILLTHDHAVADHYDPVMLSALGGTRVRVMVPEAMLDNVRQSTSLAERQIIVVEHNRTFTLEGIRIVPFEGWHQAIDNPASIGYRATGYRVDIGEQRWLFLGDVRDYRSASMNDFERMDCLFAHL